MQVELGKTVGGSRDRGGSYRREGCDDQQNRENRRVAGGAHWDAPLAAVPEVMEWYNRRVWSATRQLKYALGESTDRSTETVLVVDVLGEPVRLR